MPILRSWVGDWEMARVPAFSSALWEFYDLPAHPIMPLYENSLPTGPTGALLGQGSILTRRKATWVAIDTKNPTKIRKAERC